MQTRVVQCGAAVAATAAALLIARRVLMPHMADRALRQLILQHVAVLGALREHAGTARRLGSALESRLSDRSELAKRQRALRLVQGRTIAGLTRGRALVDELLIQLREGADARQRVAPVALAALRACEARARADLESELAAAPNETSRSPAPPTRQETLRLEADALAALEATPAVTAGPRQLRALRRVLSSLRALETSLDFQAALLVEQRRVSDATGYEVDNFAYGSTPLASWLGLFGCDTVQQALSERDADGARRTARYVVLGSSIGWL